MCGAVRQRDAEQCPNCGARWEPAGLDDDPASIAALLNAIEGWRADGLLDNASARRLREQYEERRARLLTPAGQQPGATAVSTTSTPTPAPASPLRTPDPTPPPAPRATTSVGEWAARRQADVLLYVGAFLLVISALIFVSSQDEALAGAWRVAILAAYTVAFMAAGLLLQRWPRVREAGPAFLAIGALMTPLNFLLLHNEVLSDRDVPGELVWFIASLYSAAFYGVLFAARAGRLYAIPAGAAVLSAWGSLAVTIGVPVEWGGAWWMTFALVGTDLVSATRRWSDRVLAAISIVATLAALYAAAVGLVTDEHRWQLAVTLGLLVALVTVAGAARREAIATLAAAVLAIAAAVAGLWAAGFEPEWYGFPPLLAGALFLAARRSWLTSEPQLGFGALLLATAAGLWPFVLIGAHLEGDSMIAAVAFLGSGLLFAAMAWLNTAEGFSPWIEDSRGPQGNLRPTPPSERVVFGWLAFAAALVALGFAQRAQGLSPPDTGWVLAAIAAGASAAMMLTARERPGMVWAILPPLLLAIGVSLQPLDEHIGHDAVLLALAAPHVLGAFVVLRRWSLAVAGTAAAMSALAVLWYLQDWQWWHLAVTYSALGIVLFGLLAPLRRYERGAFDEDAETLLSVQALSWLPVLVAAGTAAAALGERADTPAVDVATTVEYRALLLVVLAVGALIAIEARRLGQWEPALAAYAILLAVIAASWPVFGWAGWTLAATFSLAGAGVFAALTRWRRPGTAAPEVSVQLIAWSGLVLGPLVALSALGDRLEGLDTEPATLVEFRVLALLFLPLAGAAAFEGYRLGARWAYLPASALVMVALELAIATLEPGNVQAYTIPAALYLALVGLTMRPSERLSQHLGWHEVLQVAGAGLLVIPQAEQGFEPGGARWGLILLVEGLALLGVAIALNTRWLALTAVATLSGVALRFLWVNRDTNVVPYWVMLAVAGFALLAVGVTVLLQREWWDRNRARLQRRWRQDALLDAHVVGETPVPALLTALAPVLAILAVTTGD
ncbi:MAG: hypothetical protein OXC56_02785 [Chloroflexi bacterium]|nr:hypothetical protein [Chloroflexota bacterium]